MKTSENTHEWFKKSEPREEKGFPNREFMSLKLNIFVRVHGL